MSKVVLTGRLTRDPEVRYSSGEKSVTIAHYTLAADRRGRHGNNNGERTADFIPRITFDRVAGFAEKYFRWGMHVLVSDRIQTGSCTNHEGQKVYTTGVILGGQGFVDSGGTGNGGNGNYNSAPQTDYVEERRPNPQSTSTEGSMNTPDGAKDKGPPFS